VRARMSLRNSKVSVAKEKPGTAARRSGPATGLTGPTEAHAVVRSATPTAIQRFTIGPNPPLELGGREWPPDADFTRGDASLADYPKRLAVFRSRPAAGPVSAVCYPHSRPR
jgi:hypothetical protein